LTNHDPIQARILHAKSASATSSRHVYSSPRQADYDESNEEDGSFEKFDISEKVQNNLRGTLQNQGIP